MKAFLKYILIFACGFLVSYLSFSHHHNKKPIKRQISGEEIIENSAYNRVLSSLVKEKPCLEMTKDESLQVDYALIALKTFPEINKIRIAAVQYFGENPYRREGGKYSTICIPDDVKAEIEAEIIKQGMFKRKIIEPDYLRLIFSLNTNNPEIIKAVGDMAFYPEVAGFSTGDARPLARLVLSSFGAKSPEWSEEATKQISNIDKLGRSAAAVSAANGNSEGIEKISLLIEQIISKNTVIKYKDVEPLYELVSAMALAGDKARPFIASLVLLSDKKIEAAAPPFGIIEVSPKFLCPAAEKIGGDEAQKILQKEFCLSKEIN